jgi:hypothetical protein
MVKWMQKNSAKLAILQKKVEKGIDKVCPPNGSKKGPELSEMAQSQCASPGGAVDDSLSLVATYTAITLLRNKSIRTDTNLKTSLVSVRAMFNSEGRPDGRTLTCPDPIQEEMDAVLGGPIKKISAGTRAAPAKSEPRQAAKRSATASQPGQSEEHGAHEAATQPAAEAAAASTSGRISTTGRKLPATFCEPSTQPAAEAATASSPGTSSTATTRRGSGVAATRQAKRCAEAPGQPAAVRQTLRPRVSQPPLESALEEAIEACENEGKESYADAAAALLGPEAANAVMAAESLGTEAATETVEQLQTRPRRKWNPKSVRPDVSLLGSAPPRRKKTGKQSVA